MFFAPKLPITTYEKVVIETEIQRLMDGFGVEHLRKQRVLFPDDSGLGLQSLSQEQDVVELRNRIAAIFGVDENVVDVEFGEVDDWGFETAIRHDDGRVISQVRKDMLHDRVRVATHLAASCSSHVLRESSHADIVCESLREYVAMWYGFGPMMADASVRTSQFMNGGWDQWSISRLGLLSAIQLGYAMAVQAYVLGDGLPQWHANLTIDARESMAKGFKYLTKTTDCLVDVENSSLLWDRAQIEQNLTSRFASNRLVALQRFPDSGDTLDETEVVQTLVTINDKDLNVRQRAYQLLEFAPSSTAEVVQAIEYGFDDPDITIRASSLRASGVHGHAIEGLEFRLRRVLKSSDRELMVHAAASMAANELCDDESLKVLLEKLKMSLVRGNGDAPTLISVLRYVHDDCEQLVMAYFEHDEDLQNSVSHLLDDA